MSLNQSLSYGDCPDCQRRRTTTVWCKHCDIANLKENFPSWTSGNSKIDELIRFTQLNANENMDYLEWIEFDQFDLIENINKRGAFSSIYPAIWMEGPRWKLDEEAEVWTRNGPTKVILKRLDNSQNMSQDFIKQLYDHHKCLQSGALADCFGITRDPTSCYMLVMRCYKNGSLYSYLEESMGILCWRDIVDMLWSVSTGLKFIHECGLIHGHLHGGNVLVESEIDSIDAKIADTGLHGPVDKQISSKQIYGVVPFVAPEIFNGNTPTKASDIYSFGMIMWTLSAGIRPYCDKPHDKQLIQEICSGLRPSVVVGAPPVFAKLMSQCLDANPSNRPIASQLYECLGNWVTAICDDPDSSELSNQFDAAEEIKFAKLESNICEKHELHEKAFYYSRPLDMVKIDYRECQFEIIDADKDIQDDVELIVQIDDPPSKRVLVYLNLKDRLSKIRERLEQNSKVKMNETFSFANKISQTNNRSSGSLAEIAREDEEKIILEKIIRNKSKILYLVSEPDWKYLGPTFKESSNWRFSPYICY